MPVPLPPEAPDTPPLSTAEFVELLDLIQSATPEREARSGQVLIDIEELPRPAATEQMIADENQQLQALEEADILERSVGGMGNMPAWFEAGVGLAPANSAAWQV